MKFEKWVVANGHRYFHIHSGRVVVCTPSAYHLVRFGDVESVDIGKSARNGGRLTRLWRPRK